MPCHYSFTRYHRGSENLRIQRIWVSRSLLFSRLGSVGVALSRWKPVWKYLRVAYHITYLPYILIIWDSMTPGGSVGEGIYIPYCILGKYVSMVSTVSTVSLRYILTIWESIGEGMMRYIPYGMIGKYVSMASMVSNHKHTIDWSPL